MLVLHLDTYHLGDPLFVTGLARDLQARGGGAVLVHGSAERGERAIEGLGHPAVATDGVWEVPDPEAGAAVEAAGRDLNREIAHALNEAGVASVRVIGADRGLLRLRDDSLGVGRTGWIADLVGQGVVVVVASYVDGDEASLREVSAAQAASRLAEDLSSPVSMLEKSPSSPRRDSFSGDASASLPDPEAAKRLLVEGVKVVVLQRSALRSGEEGVSLNAPNPSV